MPFLRKRIMRIIYSSASYRKSVLRAVFSIVLGVVLVMWPGTALNYIIMLIGALFLISGLISFAYSYRNRVDTKSSGLLSFNGIGSIILGLLLVCVPSAFAKVLMFVLGFILVVAAIGQMVVLSSAKKFGYSSPVFSYLFPALILIAGIIILFDPFKSAESIFILFGITAIFYGVTDLISQYNINRVRKTAERQKKENGEDDIEDVDYEEIK